MTDHDTPGAHNQPEEKQCRICLDGEDAGHELGRLIRPCLCRGSISVRSGIVIVNNLTMFATTVCPS
jgi:E3 ubiquitin-protein ligase DOA10